MEIIPLSLSPGQATPDVLRGKEGEGLSASMAEAAPDPNPVVMFIVRLLAPATATDDGIASQTGHRRRMSLSQSAAQSVSSLRGRPQSGIKRTVTHRG